VLHDKYLFPAAEADALASFLTPMLRLHPDKRAKASELIHHRWLDSVVVQGEIDVIRRAESEEEERRRGVGGQGGLVAGAPQGIVRSASVASTSGSTRPEDERQQGKRVERGLTQSEVDAMKPVDDAAGRGEAAAHSSSPPSRIASASAGAKENSGTSRATPVEVSSPSRGDPGTGTGTGKGKGGSKRRS
jgi:serine/threonine-protein kinase SRPK3